LRGSGYRYECEAHKSPKARSKPCCSGISQNRKCGWVFYKFFCLVKGKMVATNWNITAMALWYFLGECGWTKWMRRGRAERRTKSVGDFSVNVIRKDELQNEQHEPCPRG
jgi:hypothetical protein